ncbi:MAG: hypothetical protein AB7U35_10170 [Sphingobium sp.]
MITSFRWWRQNGRICSATEANGRETEVGAESQGAYKRLTECIGPTKTAQPVEKTEVKETKLRGFWISALKHCSLKRASDH